MSVVSMASNIVRNTRFRNVACWLIFASFSTEAFAVDNCYQWTTDLVAWYSTANAAEKAYIDWCNTKLSVDGYCGGYSNGYCSASHPSHQSCYMTQTVMGIENSSGGYITLPKYNVHIIKDDGGAYDQSGTFWANSRQNPNGCGAYVSAMFLPPAQCGPTCNGVAEPINPASGAVYDSTEDVLGPTDSFHFRRFYNSTDSGSAAISSGWRYSFSRSVVAQYSTINTQPYIQSASNSSLYATPDAACANGFAEIRSQVASWAGATALYSNGTCQLSKSGVSIGSVPVYTQAGGLGRRPTPNAYDVIRDDGQVIRFTVSGTSIVAPPSINMKLQQAAGGGYTLTDGNDNVEIYDTSGKLFSVISRAGVVQTMSYDGSGRLSGVTDNFGHQITLGYDSQNRLISVIRQ